jgi:hypothetical protein
LQGCNLCTFNRAAQKHSARFTPRENKGFKSAPTPPAVPKAKTNCSSPPQINTHKRNQIALYSSLTKKNENTPAFK